MTADNKTKNNVDNYRKYFQGTIDLVSIIYIYLFLNIHCDNNTEDSPDTGKSQRGYCLVRLIYFKTSKSKKLTKSNS